MQRTQIKIIKFVNGFDGDEGFALVSVANSSVGVTLSLQHNGDIEVFLPAEAARALSEALVQAAEIAEKTDI